MAAIEKICELTGEYPGHKMYDYKRDSIQVVPKARKLFRKCSCFLYFFKPEIMSISKSGLIYFGELDGYKHVTRYEYVLQVFDDTLKGSVNGLYTNTTYKKSTVVRKLKRLTRNYRLHIVNQPEFEYHEWIRYLENA